MSPTPEALVTIATTTREENIGAPVHVDVSAEIERAFGVRCSATSSALCSKIAPVGFGKKSTFAYATEPPDEACGCWFYDVIVQDLKSDEILWKLKGNTPLEGGQPGPRSLVELWKANPEIAAELAKAEIEPASLALRQFPAGDVGVAVKKEVATSPDWGFDVVHRVTIELVSPKGRKTILDRKIERSAVLDAHVLGYLSSPYEARVAVVLATMERGYEGAPHPIEIEIVGADLAGGFR